VTIKFDRQELLATVRAGVASGWIDPSEPLNVRLLASNDREIGSSFIRVLQK
jgi:hypothetical protein